MEQKTIFTITISNQEMVVHYDPHYLKNYLAHIEFHSPYDPPRRIPVSETGYRSQFVAPQAVEAAPSIREYARMLALAIIDDKATQRKDEAEDEQMLLF